MSEPSPLAVKTASALATDPAPLSAWPLLWPPVRLAMHAADPERAHGAAVALLSVLGATAAGRALLRLLAGAPVADPVTVMGLRFPNRVGLAAGWDKDARAWPAMCSLGFGHVEVGTLTPRPQAGNARPRVFRLAADQALINRMGFPGQGAAAAVPRLQGPGAPGARPGLAILGVNLGRNAGTDNADTAADAIAVLEAVAATADYLALNVSSPNTSGLRALQHGEALAALVGAVAARRDALVANGASGGRALPLAVKIAPDLDAAQLDAAVDAAIAGGAQAIIATNTTLARDDGHGAALRSAHRSEAGGLSGRPLEARARAVLAQVARRADGRLALIAVGGIGNAEDARVRIELGADLVQVFTGLVYHGPRLIAQAALGARRGGAARRVED